MTGVQTCALPIFRFRAACVETLEADPAACARHLDASTAPALLLVPRLGYDAAAALAKAALETGKSVSQLAAEQEEREGRS